MVEIRRHLKCRLVIQAWFRFMKGTGTENKIQIVHVPLNTVFMNGTSRKVCFLFFFNASHKALFSWATKVQWGPGSLCRGQPCCPAVGASASSRSQEWGARTCPKVEGAHGQGGPGTEVPKASGPFTKAQWADVQLPVRQEGYLWPRLGQWQLEPMDARDTQQHASSQSQVHLLILSTGHIIGLATLSEQLRGKGWEPAARQVPRRQAAPSARKSMFKKLFI